MDTRSKHSHQKPSRNYHFTGILPFEHTMHAQWEILSSYPDTVFTKPPFVSQIWKTIESKAYWYRSRKDECDSDRSKQACKRQSCNGIFCEYRHTQYPLLALWFLHYWGLYHSKIVSKCHAMPLCCWPWYSLFHTVTSGFVTSKL